MTAVTSPLPVASKRHASQNHWWVSLVPASIAESVDAIGYLVLMKELHLAHERKRGGNGDAGRDEGLARKLAPLRTYCCALPWRRARIDGDRRIHTPEASRLFAVVAFAETVLLAAFLFVAPPAPEWAVIFPASAMGAQNELLRRVGSRNVRTTFVTGMLTDAAAGLVEAITCLITRNCAEVEENSRYFALRGGIWLSFTAALSPGVALPPTNGSSRYLLPILALIALIILDLVHPFTEPTSRIYDSFTNSNKA